MWQKVYEELGPQGLDIVTVALDSDPEAARPFAVAANPTHPSLLDRSLLTVERFGFTNVPFGIWIDEAGTACPPRRGGLPEPGTGPQEPEHRREPSGRDPPGGRGHDGKPGRHPSVHRSRPGLGRQGIQEPIRPLARGGRRPFASPPAEFTLATAEFELGQHLHRGGDGLDALTHFREAHRLDPENWSYKRQAYSLVDSSWGQVYQRDLLSEVAAIGPETFYPSLDM